MKNQDSQPGQQSSSKSWKLCFWLTRSTATLYELGLLGAVALVLLTIFIDLYLFAVSSSALWLASCPLVYAGAIYLIRYTSRIQIQGETIRWISLIGKLEASTSELSGWLEVPEKFYLAPRVRIENHVLIVPIHSISKFGDLREELMRTFGLPQLPVPYSVAGALPPHRSLLVSFAVQLVMICGIAPSVLKALRRPIEAHWIYAGAISLLLLIGIGFLLSWWQWPADRVIVDDDIIRFTSGRQRTEELIAYDRIEMARRFPLGDNEQFGSLQLGFRHKDGNWKLIRIPESSLNFDSLVAHVEARVPRRSVRR